MLTLTADIGSEFDNHEVIAQELNANFYFPLVAIGKMGQREWDNRPRKCLDMKTPDQVVFRIALAVSLGP